MYVCMYVHTYSYQGIIISKETLMPFVPIYVRTYVLLNIKKNYFYYYVNNQHQRKKKEMYKREERA